MHWLLGYGVLEPEFSGMKHQPLVLLSCAIKLVTNDGTPQPVRMGTMDAQLVGAPSLRPQRHHAIRQEFVVGNGPLAMFRVDQLAGAVHGVRPQGQRDTALRQNRSILNTLSIQRIWFFQDCQVLFLYLVLHELLLQVMVNLLCLGHDKQSAGTHIEPVGHNAT